MLCSVFGRGGRPWQDVCSVMPPSTDVMLCYVRCSERVAGWMFDVRCSMFGCSMFDVMFGQADVMLC